MTNRVGSTPGDYDAWLDTRVLVCGDRDWTDQRIVGTMLEGLLQETMLNFGRLFVIEGCARGADSFAHHFFDGPCEAPGGGTHAAHTHVVHEHFPALWDEHGKAAGPIRNRQMLAAKPDIVVAFHDDLANSKGTKDMVTIAKKVGVPVYVVSHA